MSTVELLSIIIILIGTRFFLHRGLHEGSTWSQGRSGGRPGGGIDVCRQGVAVVRMAKQLSLNSNEVLQVNEEW